MGSFAECHIKVGSTCTLRGPSFLYRSREGFHGFPQSNQHHLLTVPYLLLCWRCPLFWKV